MTQYLLKSFGKAQDVYITYIPVNFHEKIMRPYKVLSEKQNNPCKLEMGQPGPITDLVTHIFEQSCEKSM